MSTGDGFAWTGAGWLERGRMAQGRNGDLGQDGDTGTQEAEHQAALEDDGAAAAANGDGHGRGLGSSRRHGRATGRSGNLGRRGRHVRRRVPGRHGVGRGKVDGRVVGAAGADDAAAARGGVVVDAAGRAAGAGRAGAARAVGDRGVARGDGDGPRHGGSRSGGARGRGLGRSHGSEGGDDAVNEVRSEHLDCVSERMWRLFVYR